MFSIIIPLHNKELRIYHTIQSLLNQSFQEFEIVIIDDGSTDRSVEIVEKFEDSRIRLIRQKNEGVSAARNKGIEYANYDWIALLDADDYWECAFLEEINTAIKNYPDRSIFVGGASVYRNSQFVRPLNKLLPKDGQTGLLNYYEAVAFYGSPINSSNVVLKKSHLYKYGLFEVGQKNYEDFTLWIRLCVHEPVVYVNKQLSVYVLDNSPSASKGSYSAQDFMTVMNTFLELKGKLSDKDFNNLKMFYNRHCVGVMLRHFERYSKLEKKKALKLMSLVLTWRVFFKIKIIYLMRLSKPILLAKKYRAKYRK